MTNKVLSIEIAELTVKYRPRMCWSNAVEALCTVDHPALINAMCVEGWAVRRNIHAVVEHGWLRLENGDILDLTWTDAEGVEYFAGVSYAKSTLIALDPDFLPIAWDAWQPKGFGNPQYARSYYAAVRAMLKQEKHAIS